MAKKEKKEPAWSHRASPKASVAIRELQKVREQQALLTKKAALLQELIVKEGGGFAHGVRAAVRHQRASERRTIVRTKERTYVTFLKPLQQAEPRA